MTVKTWQQGSSIYVAPELPDEHRAARAIEGGEYVPGYNVFRFPASSLAAFRLYSVFGFGSLYDANVRALIRQHTAESRGSDVPSVAWPTSVKIRPWAHQKCAYDYVRHRLDTYGSAGLFSGMGTGKSLVLMALLAAYRPLRSLIVCEKNMVETWARMIEESVDGSDWPYRIVPLPSGTPIVERAKLVQDAIRRPDHVSLIFVTNYEAVWQGMLGSQLKRAELDFVALDESHRIKSPSGKASGFLYRLGKNAKYRVCMTGTPSHDKPLDVYAQYRFLDDSIFGTNFERFKARYAIEVQRKTFKQVVGYQNQDELSQRMYTRAFRVPESVLDLPPLVVSDRFLELEPEARKAYDRLYNDLVLETDSGIVTASNVLVRTIRLQQLVNGYLPLHESFSDEGVDKQKISDAKRSALTELFQDIPESEPIVVFGRFLTDLDQIRWAAEECGRGYVEQSGRGGNWQKWQLKMSGGDVLGVQIQSGGSGIDLTRARYGVYFSTGHSLGQYEQSLRRLHRPGQTKRTIIYRLWVSDTVDIIVRRALSEKRDVASLIVDELYRRYRAA